MSYEVGQKAIDYLLENSGHHRNLDIDFLAGNRSWLGKWLNRS